MSHQSSLRTFESLFYTYIYPNKFGPKRGEMARSVRLTHPYGEEHTQAMATGEDSRNSKTVSCMRFKNSKVYVRSYLATIILIVLCSISIMIAFSSLLPKTNFPSSPNTVLYFPLSVPVNAGICTLAGLRDVLKIA